MVRNGTRRCDLCTQKILGNGGDDICVICRIAMEEDPQYVLEAERAPDLEETEAFALTAIVGTSHVAADLVEAANDASKGLPAHVRRLHAPKRSDVGGMVQRFAAGLRSISRRRVDDGR